MQLTPEQLERFKAAYGGLKGHYPGFALSLLEYINEKWPSFIPSIIHAVTTKDEVSG